MATVPGTVSRVPCAQTCRSPSCRDVAEKRAPLPPHLWGTPWGPVAYAYQDIFGSCWMRPCHLVPRAAYNTPSGLCAIYINHNEFYLTRDISEHCSIFTKLNCLHNVLTSATTHSRVCYNINQMLQ